MTIYVQVYIGGCVGTSRHNGHYFPQKIRKKYLVGCVGSVAFCRFLPIRSGYMAGCGVITGLGRNKMKVSTTKGYVPNLVIFKKKY